MRAKITDWRASSHRWSLALVATFGMTLLPRSDVWAESVVDAERRYRQPAALIRRIEAMPAEQLRGEVITRLEHLSSRYGAWYQPLSNRVASLGADEIKGWLLHRLQTAGDRPRVASTANSSVDETILGGAGFGDYPLMLRENGLMLFGELGIGLGPEAPGGGFDSSGHQAFYDYDGDGDLDVFAGNKYNDGLQYWENRTGEMDSPFPADIQYFEPIDGPQSPVDGLVLVSAEDVAPAIADLDGDGAPELYVGSFNGDIQIFDLPDPMSAEPGPIGGPATFLQDSSMTIIDVGEQSTPTFIDIDDDDDLDLFIGDTDGNITFYENDGDDENPSFVERTGGANPLGAAGLNDDSTPFFADIDNDGDFDAFIGDKGIVHYFENTGDAENPVFVERTGEAHPLLGFIGVAPSPALVDIDADGDLDAFIGGKPGSPLFFENRGDISSPAFLDHGFSTELADLDGDGDLDALVGTYGGGLVEGPDRGPQGGGPLASPQGLTYFENTGDSRNPRWERRLGPNSPIGTLALDIPLLSPELVDIDGDGDLDLFVGEKLYGDNAGVIRFFENVGTPTSPSFVERTGTANPLDGYESTGINCLGNGGCSDYGRPDPSFADIDGDGDYDVFVGEFTYGGTDLQQIRYFRNDGDPMAPTFTEVVGVGNPLDFSQVDTPFDVVGFSPFFVDYDGDGDLDAFIGAKIASEEVGPDTLGPPINLVATVLFYENTGDDENPAFEFVGDSVPVPQSPTHVPSFAAVGFTPTMTVADIDGDGDYDSFIGGYTGHEAFTGYGGISVDPTSVTTTESGGTDTFDVVLTAPPLNVTGPGGGVGVTLDVTSDDLTEGTVSPSTLMFDGGNWDVPQTVTVTGVDDPDLDGNIDYNIIIEAADGSGAFAGAAPVIVTAVNVDNEGLGSTVSATKEVSGDFAPGGVITYTVTLDNAGPAEQGDNPGAEFVDVLPAELTALAVDATSGDATLTGNTVNWNGTIPATGSVIITITAQLGDIALGTEILNQGTVNFDTNGDGTNDGSAPSDDPDLPGPDDPTPFIVGGTINPLVIPTLSQVSQWFLGGVLALFGVLGLRRRL